MGKRVAIVSGAYGAIGKAIALGLAKMQDFEVVLVGRDQGKLRSAAQEISDISANHNIRTEGVDLSDKHAIIGLKNRWEGPLHILVNNAATTPRQQEFTAAGIEMQWATNVLGYFWMMLYMKEHMKDPANTRIINVASYWAGDLEIDDVEFKNRPYHNNTAYRQSKQANRMLSVIFADKLSSYGITVNSCHPGDVNSKLSQALGFGGSESPDLAAATPIWLATNSNQNGISGKYFENLAQRHCQFSGESYNIQSLYNLCMSYTV